MFRLPLREKPEPPADPIDVDIPVDLFTENRSPQPLALEENSTDPIQEVAVLHPADLFEAQCRDQTARNRDAQLGTDPTWDFDRHWLLVQRLPSGEVVLHVPHGLRAGGPYAVVLPLAEDGSVSSEGEEAESPIAGFSSALPRLSARHHNREASQQVSPLGRPEFFGGTPQTRVRDVS
jgi:hypothetical protein